MASSQQTIQIGPPDLRAVDAKVLAVCRYLYKNPLLKQRSVLLGGQRMDMFRLKRATRALEGPEYSKARAKTPLLPDFKSKNDIIALLKQLPANRMAFQIKKLETAEALEKNLKPQSGVPCALISPQQSFEDDDYFVWYYNPVPVTTYLYGALALVLALTVVLFPLWPARMRTLAWYVSMAALVFLGFLLVVSVVRLLLFIVTYFTVPPGLWLFPNLYADVDFLASWVPVFAWHGQRTLPKKPKKKKRTKPAAPAVASQASSAAPTGTIPAGAIPVGGIPGMVPGALPNGMPILPGVNAPLPANATPQQAVQAMIQGEFIKAQKKAQEKIQAQIQTEGPKSQEQLQALFRQYVGEEMKASESRLRDLAVKAEAMKQKQEQQQ